jgi:antitoxin component YwqK of YwqJK toxin-antitoxin module
MTEEQLARNRRLLRLKGAPVEEDEPEVKIDTGQILRQHQERRQSKQDSEKFDDLDMQWNQDGTLAHLTAYKDGTVLYEMDFAWNPDGSLSKIMRS